MTDQLPWFRLWTDIIDDDKIRMLAFEDRWHFVALMALKRSGFLDRDQSRPTFRRGLEIKMGLTGVDLDNMKLRLLEVDLIEDDWTPISWDKRQAKSDSSTERVRKYRRNQKKKNETHDETLQKRSSNALELEEELEEELEPRGAARVSSKTLEHVFQGADTTVVNLYLQRRIKHGKPVDQFGLDQTRRILALCETPAQRSEALENSGSERHAQVYERHLPESLRRPDKPTGTLADAAEELTRRMIADGRMTPDGKMVDEVNA